MWLTCLLILLAVLAFTSWKAGPHRAAGVTVALAMLVPTWVEQEVWGFAVNIPLSIGITVLGAYCVHPKAIFRVQLAFLDWIIFALFVVHICCDWGHQGFSWFVPLRAYGEWYVPYVTGRVAFRGADDVRGQSRIMVFIVIVFSIVSAIQGLSGIDLAESIFGSGQVDVGMRDVSRWGIHRAFGPLRNSNYFAALQLLLLPWSVYVAVAAFNHRGPGWWMMLPLVTAVGIFFPMSRAAWGGLAISLILAWLLTHTRWKVTIPIFAGILAAAICLKPDLTVNLLEALTSGNLNEISDQAPTRQFKITMGEKKVRYTGALNRFYVVQIYAPAVLKGGLFGYGTEAVTGFPVNVPIGQQDLMTMKVIKTIDNAYLLMALRFGYLGLACFTAWCISIPFTWGQITLCQPAWPEMKAFTATMAGVSGAMLLVFLTVWMPQDFGFWYLWTAGACGGLYEGFHRSQAVVTGTKQNGGPVKASRRR